MKMFLAVAAGGALGACARHAVNILSLRMMGPGFPWGTLTVNIAGSLLLGALVGYLALKGHISPEWRAFLVVGVLGAFTTFSAFSMDSVLLAERQAFGPLALYLLASVGGALLAFLAGIRVVRLLLG